MSIATEQKLIDLEARIAALENIVNPEYTSKLLNPLHGSPTDMADFKPGSVVMTSGPPQVAHTLKLKRG